MKTKAIFFAIVFFYCHTLFSQWAPVGAKWIYTMTFNMSNNIDTFVIHSIGDTIIQGHLCQTLQKNAGLCDLRPLKEYMYEDSGKVFFYDETRNIFQMLYNFNGNIGDSTIIYPDDYPSTDYISATIDSISSININSHILKRLFVHYSSSSFIWTPMGGDIIENIGDIHYMFPWTFYGCDAQWAGPLRCYEDTVIGPFNFNTAVSCDYVYVEINTPKCLINFSTFPNPFTNSAVISIPEYLTLNNVIVDIFDLQGRKIKEFHNINTPQLTLSRADFNTPGIYFIKIKSTQFSETIKLIVQ